MKYTYFQFTLDPEPLRHCNCQIVSSEYSSTYSFLPFFYALTDMLAAFQLFMCYALNGLKVTNWISFDILIVCRGSQGKHLK